MHRVRESESRYLYMTGNELIWCWDDLGPGGVVMHVCRYRFVFVLLPPNHHLLTFVTKTFPFARISVSSGLPRVRERGDVTELQLRLFQLPPIHVASYNLFRSSQMEEFEQKLRGRPNVMLGGLFVPVRVQATVAGLRPSAPATLENPV